MCEHLIKFEDTMCEHSIKFEDTMCEHPFKFEDTWSKLGLFNAKRLSKMSAPT